MLVAEFSRVSASQSPGPPHAVTVGVDHRQVLDTLADAVVAADASNRIIYLNRAAETLLGWQADELIGRSLTVIQPERFRQAHLNGFQRFVATRVPHIVGNSIRVPALRWDGSEIDIELTIAALPDGDTPVVVASLHDLRAHMELEQAEHRFAFLAEASRVLATSLDYRQTLANVAQLAVPHLADWCVVDVLNDEGEIQRLAVTHVDAMKAELARDMTHRYPPDRARDAAIYLVIETGEPLLVSDIPDESLKRFARDPEHLAFLREMGITSYMCVPLSAHGRIRGAIGFVAAESGRQYGADDLALALDLAHRAAIAVDNASLYGELNEAVRIRDEFLASVSHDLKNPIAAIKGRAQMLERRAQELPPDEAGRFLQSLESIDSSATRMSRLISDLVDVARLRIGQPLDLRYEEIDLIELIRNVVAEVKPTTDHHTIRVEAEKEPLTGEWDPSRIERVLANLLTNAIKYSPEGGEITVNARIEASENGQSAAILVSDRGIGIPEDDVPHIFQRYYRASNVQATFEGTGVGLAAARQIVEQHRGTISVEGREGGGTIFIVRLPLERALSLEADSC
jgi:PAS domain S-box-containing protein